jgi:hypothetical protein
MRTTYNRQKMARLRQRRTGASSAPRSGTVLLIVLVFLTLFAAIGLAFMFYADSDAQIASAFKESVEPQTPDVAPEDAFAQFLQQLIFDCLDDETGVYSAARGHSLFRNMYGGNYHVEANGDVIPLDNDTAFNGTGRLRWKHTVGGVPDAPGMLANVNDVNLVNYMYFVQDNFLRDPERLGVRPKVGGKFGLLRAPGKPDNRAPFIGGFNPPYTACDLNCMCLAAVQADGTLLMPSYFRDWTGFGAMDPNNNNWYSNNDPTMKYKVLRPRPADHPSVVVNGVTKAGFPAPEDKNGDVQNLKWGKGTDSMWIYTGAPIMKMPDGRMYTMLFAPCIVDLDGKINVNVAGNVRVGPGTSQAGNQGWGPWEIALANALLPIIGNAEFQQLCLGVNAVGTTTPRVPGKYGTYGAGTPGPGIKTTTAATFNRNGKIPGFYSQVDFSGTANAPWTLPGAPGKQWPTYPGYGNASLADRTQHPELYNVFNPTAVSTAAPSHMNRGFSVTEMDKLLRYGDIGTEAMVSDLFLICPQSFATQKNRNLVTTLSWDRNVVGQAPWLYSKPANGTNLKFTMPGNGDWETPISGGPMPFPLPVPSVAKFPTSTGGLEFTPDWRGKPFTTAKIDLNRLLRAYPAANWTPAGGKNTFRFPQIVDPNTGALVLDTKSAQYTAYMNAQSDRQLLAKEIFEVLLHVTGATHPATYVKTAGISAAEINAVRYLAQLAVNIVDFIDDDDIITPFNWSAIGSADFLASNAFNNALKADSSSGWVFGVELPKVVINEAYAEITNDPTDPGITGSTGATKDYLVDLWAELHNPLNTDANLVHSGDARLHMYTTAKTPGYPVYKLKVVSDPAMGTVMHRATNSTGDPHTTATTLKGTVDKEFEHIAGAPGTDISVIHPNNGNFAAAGALKNQGNNMGFYMVGPQTKDATGKPIAVPFPTDPNVPPTANQMPPSATANGQGMRYTLPVGPALASAKITGTVKGPGLQTTINTTSTAGLKNGALVTIKGATMPPGLNGTWIINSVTPTSFRVAFGQGVNFTGDDGIWVVVPPFVPQNPSLVLQRLLCPYAPPDNNPASATYNPYITVDYFQNVPVNIGVKVGPPIQGGGDATLAAFTPVQARFSVGRKQPYAGGDIATNVKKQYVKYAEDGAPSNWQRNQPNHTFFHHNNRHNKAYPPAPTDIVNSKYTGVWTDATVPGFPPVGGTIIGASNAKPIIITTAAPHGLATGDEVTITGVLGNTAANGAWTITALTPKTFRLIGATGNGVWTPGGQQTWGYPAFDWLCHLDRPLVSPIELLQVSEARPHELTQMFVIGGKPHNQRVGGSTTGFVGNPGGGAGWFDNDRRLYRMFEYVQTWPYKNVGMQTRLPGKVNLNTIWDKEIFYALCDPRAGGPNHYNEAQVKAIWQALLNSRDPLVGGIHKPGANSRPFLSLSTGFTTGDLIHQGTSGVHHTFLKAFGNNNEESEKVQRLFEVTGAKHPAEKYELLAKLFNSVTNRSNVFAVWVTVGFFEVNKVDVTPGVGQRIYLGQEIGRADNKHKRHRMFGIIDRSIDLPALGAGTLKNNGPDITAQGVQEVPVSALKGTANSNGATYHWNIQRDTMLRIKDKAGVFNFVKVLSVKTLPGNNFTITADFQSPAGFDAGVALAFPQANNSAMVVGFNPHASSTLLRYFTIIE